MPSPGRPRLHPEHYATERRCLVCARLAPNELAMFDELLGDPTRWPRNVWGAVRPPEGMLPGNYRSFGAIATGLWWLSEHGYQDIRRTSVQSHYRRHVIPKPVETEALVEAGIVGAPAIVNPSEPVDPRRFLIYYAKGVDVGIKALEEIARQLDNLAANGRDAPLTLLRIAADLGRSVAVSQASIRAAGKHIGDEEDDDEFRGAATGERELVRPAKDFAVREIEGEARPVLDKGRADRERYNERARKEGAPLLGG